ncbi:MAG: hypothetical protein PUG56_00905 [Ruminococcus sp.]|nr:hypothetical protein [Ruminococcus sp.]MDD7614145.1 hypothetical protein [Clostridiaceae bacterium]MDY5889701.1 hypothetical protein [Oscillospiraceae bacterium]
MSTKKSAAELKVEYERALARAEQLKQKMKSATAAEEAKKKSELLQLVSHGAVNHNLLDKNAKNCRKHNDINMNSS